MTRVKLQKNTKKVVTHQHTVAGWATGTPRKLCGPRTTYCVL